MGIKYLNVEELADYLGVTAQSIYRRRSAGLPMPPSTSYGKLLRWREDAVDEWMLKREGKTAA